MKKLEREKRQLSNMYGVVEIERQKNDKTAVGDLTCGKL